MHLKPKYLRTMNSETLEYGGSLIIWQLMEGKKVKELKYMLSRLFKL